MMLSCRARLREPSSCQPIGGLSHLLPALSKVGPDLCYNAPVYISILMSAENKKFASRHGSLWKKFSSCWEAACSQCSMEPKTIGNIIDDGFLACGCRQHQHDGPGVPIMKTQDLVPMIIDPFGQAAMHALAMQSGGFEGGTFNSNGSAGRGEKRCLRQHQC